MPAKRLRVYDLDQFKLKPPPYALGGVYLNNKIPRLNIRPPPFKQALIFRIIVPICFDIAYTHT